jgi:hypothetical protein
MDGFAALNAVFIMDCSLDHLAHLAHHPHRAMAIAITARIAPNKISKNEYKNARVSKICKPLSSAGIAPSLQPHITSK